MLTPFGNCANRTLGGPNMLAGTHSTTSQDYQGNFAPQKLSSISRGCLANNTWHLELLVCLCTTHEIRGTSWML